MSEYPYEVIIPSGQTMMSSAAGIRYPRQIELSMLEAGYTIKLHGKKLTKTEIRKEVKGK